MWICDAGQLYDSISDNWCGIGIANVSEILEFVKYAPTIDPETIPIVRKLREELARVTAERDAIKKNPPVEIQTDAFALAVELAKVTAERDAAQRLLAEHTGVVGMEKVTTCFGCPLEKVLELVLAYRDGRLIIRQEKGKEAAP
ncbi:hypothetical protein [Candidatus Allofournierella excrementavium]|uniref:hypothetical protein n=1 Tax=Candidatus Allofournierella excrementavium TaxID=2838591 RepID=UPI003AB30EF1